MLAAVSLFGASLSMAVFCVVYLSWWLGASPDEWEALAPPAIPIATTCFLVGSVWHAFSTSSSSALFCPSLHSSAFSRDSALPSR